MGNYIRKARINSKLSRVQLGTQTNVSTEIIAALENGAILSKDIKTEWLDAIHKRLNIESSVEHVTEQTQQNHHTENSFSSPLKYYRWLGPVVLLLGAAILLFSTFEEPQDELAALIEASKPTIVALQPTSNALKIVTPSPTSTHEPRTSSEVLSNPQSEQPNVPQQGETSTSEVQPTQSAGENPTRDLLSFPFGEGDSYFFQMPPETTPELKPPATPSPIEPIVIVANEHAAFREGPGTDYPVFGPKVLWLGDRLKVLGKGRTQDGTIWFYVRTLTGLYPRHVGWVASVLTEAVTNFSLEDIPDRSKEFPPISGEPSSPEKTPVPSPPNPPVIEPTLPPTRTPEPTPKSPTRAPEPTPTPIPPTKTPEPTQTAVPSTKMPEPTPTEQANPCSSVLDFDRDAAGNPLQAGRIVSNEWAACGIEVSTLPDNKPPMIFNSANPSGGDDDLGTPNEDFGGTGKGKGGKNGQPGENRHPLGNILTISDGDQQNPNDNGDGGTYIFTFDRPMCIKRIQMIDIDGDNDGMPIRAFDENNNKIKEIGMNGLDDNAILNILFEVQDVYRLEINLRDSGALTAIEFCS